MFHKWVWPLFIWSCCQLSTTRVLVLCLLGLSAPISANSKAVDLLQASIAELHTALEKEQITSVELVKHYLARIEAYDQQHTSLNAIIRLNPQALQQAAELDRERQQQGARGPLHGIPIVLKDNYSTVDLATSAGSVAFANFIPPADAFQVAKLKQAGAIILAKTNMDEFAAGVFGVSSLGGQTKNPYDLTRNPGGSSGGTAVAVAARFAAVGMGTDTCGSITIPASFNGLVGLRPSRGLTSTAGIIPLDSFMDVAGPLARSVADVAIMMDAVVGYDPQDPAIAGLEKHATPGFVSALQALDISDLRLGKLNHYFHEYALSDVNTLMATAMDTLTHKGVTIVDIESALFDAIVKQVSWGAPYNYNVDMVQYFQSYPGSGFTAASDVFTKGLYIERFDDDRWPKKKSAFDQGPNQLESSLKAGWRGLLNQAIAQVMAAYDLDALIYPSVKVLPVKLGSIQEGNNCMLAALAGVPALALPVGLTAAGLPVGVDLVAQQFSDKRLLGIGYAIEQALKPIGSQSLPANTPPLVNGKAPKPIAGDVTIKGIAKVALAFDATTSQLSYKTQLLDKQPITAVCLHKTKKGAVIHCLSGPQGRRTSGVITLNASHIQALHNKQLFLRVYSQANPLGQISQRVVLPLPKQ